MLANLALLAIVAGAPQDWTDCTLFTHHPSYFLGHRQRDQQTQELAGSPEVDGHLHAHNGTFGPIEFVNATFLGTVRRT